MSNYKMNNWESRTDKFLEKSFNEDSPDIISCLQESLLPKVMEVGFGNNRLLSDILSANVKMIYLGVDKTKTFVLRARSSFNIPDISFKRLDVCDTFKFRNFIEKFDPQILIFRYVLEHLPSWNSVLETINSLKVPKLLISTFTPYRPETNQTCQASKNRKLAYTLTFFNEKDLDSILSNYSVKVIEYPGVPQRLRIYSSLNNLNNWSKK